ncbi:hypothetical protein EIP86_008113 [Pleurotus ostreatoroseus]|nr:hypothetical protein EIP86_008113 [Pleurotus ostreatoroseus]
MSENSTMGEDTSLHATSMPGTPSDKVLLNFDTLTAVIPWLQTRPNLLMITCSGLYNVGIPTLLDIHYKIIRRNLSLFYRFLVSRAPTSFLALRSLSLYFKGDIFVTKKLIWLTEILTRAENLQYLEVCVDQLRQNAALYKTLAQLRSLRTLDHFHAYGADPEHCALMAQLESPLTTLMFGNAGDDIDAVNALANFHHKLQELVISQLTLYHLPPSPVYFNVVHLSLIIISDTRLSILIPALPNLRSLIAKGLHVDHDQAAYRKDSIQFQMDYPHNAGSYQV